MCNIRSDVPGVIDGGLLVNESKLNSLEWFNTRTIKQWVKLVKEMTDEALY